MSSGLSPIQALSLRSPQMVGLFGWPEAVDADGLLPLWEAAEANTTRAMAHAFEGLTDAERRELVELANALSQATAG